MSLVGLNPQEMEFFELCKAHDLTYSYSDDGKVWRRGEESYKKIREAASLLPKERAMALWNAVVDLKIKSDHAEGYKWR